VNERIALRESYNQDISLLIATYYFFRLLDLVRNVYEC
jgi:hypothetical protein